jgi:hypothetical protein
LKIIHTAKVNIVIAPASGKYHHYDGLLSNISTFIPNRVCEDELVTIFEFRG